MKAIFGFLKDNALSLSLFALFLASLLGDSVAGLSTYNADHASQGYAPIGYWQYLGTGTFLDGVFVNWQAAILQLAVMIIFSEFLSQRGASHSRKPDDDPKERSSRQARGPGCASAEAKKRQSRAKDEEGQERRSSWLYRNSLSLAFVALFVAAFAIHLGTGAAAANEQRLLLHQQPISLIAFLTSAQLWFENFQTWEAEFFVMGVFLVLTILLRQEYSAESKPVGATDEETGNPNE